MNHSPLPWKADENSFSLIKDAEGWGIGSGKVDIVKANRELILQAVNERKGLLERIKKLEGVISAWDDFYKDRQLEEVAQLKAERNEMVAVCRLLAKSKPRDDNQDCIHCHGHEDEDHLEDCTWEKAVKALDKIKGSN